VSDLFESVLIANRGEIAVRIIRTLRELGVRSIAIYTDPDRGARHVAEADDAVGIGPAAAYLDVVRVVTAAVESGASAVHPGYGFLSENPDLGRACAAAGVTFVGPPPDAVEAMGDKIKAKRLVSAAGVPVVPGTDQSGLTDDQLVEAAAGIGLPVLLKPSAGGGGKGMRRVDTAGDLRPQISAARREALGAFGDDTLLLERFVPRPRHIEVQVLADSHGGIIALGERECSLQRRHQKIVEEAPSPLLDDETRAAMAASAVAAARACGYRSAGTVEFIVAAERPSEYFFMEMNTRLQVEHPVTEAILGIDLVEWQLRVAAGEPLPWRESGPEPAGHAVEARVYAEDPHRDFLPATGTIVHLAEPEGQHLRVDSGLQLGSVIGTDYDPMLAKVVAWGQDRKQALERLGGALARTEILGVTTNVGFLRRLVGNPEVTGARLDTQLVERIAPGLAGEAAPADVLAAAGLLSRRLAAANSPVIDPWDLADGWRLTAPAPYTTRWQIGGTAIDVTIDGDAVRVGDDPATPATARLDGPDLVVHQGTRTWRYYWASTGDTVWLGRGGDTWVLTRLRETIARTGAATHGAGPVTSPMPGTVLIVHVVPGQTVIAGEPLIAVEAMKMEHVVHAPLDGTVAQVLVKPGDRVGVDQPLAVVDAGPTPDSPANPDSPADPDSPANRDTQTHPDSQANTGEDGRSGGGGSE
jgi:acetyl-CoA/propionyl-CoA carboxylase biotin carboxyl carrier protein